MKAETLGRFGMVISLFFSGMWAIAANADPNWTFGSMSLSDMGISSVSVTAVFFNVGCIVTGILLLLFFYLLAKEDTGGGVAGAYIASFSGIFLSFVGIFNLNTGAYHYFFATTFGVLATMGVILYTMRDMNKDRGIQSAITFIMLCLGMFAVMRFEFELWEPIVVILGLVWLFLFSIGLFKPTFFWRVIKELIEE